MKRSMQVVLVMLLVGVAVGRVSAGQALDAIQKELDGLIERVLPSVVSLELPGGPDVKMIRQEEGEGDGALLKVVRINALPRQATGVVVSAEGHIVTSAAGFGPTGRDDDNDKRVVTVKTHDGRKLKAKLLEIDRRSGLAVLKLIEGELPALAISEQSAQTGKLVLVVGNSYGMERSVSLALVSGTGRTIAGGPGWSRQFNDMIQLSVPVKPGDAGGLVADTSGNVLGILHSGYRPAGAPEIWVNRAPASIPTSSGNLGFALPARVVKKVVSDVKRNGTVTWGYLGIKFSSGDNGLAVLEGLDGSPAERAGLKVGDVIKRYRVDEAEAKQDVVLEGAPEDSSRFVDAVSFTPPGTKATLTVNRDGKELKLTVVVGLAPVEKPEQFKVEQHRFGFERFFPDLKHGEHGEHGEKRTWLGVRLERTDDGMGVKVVGVIDASPAAKHGLREQDVILEADGEPVNEPARFRELVLARKPADKMELKVRRGNQEIIIEVTLGESRASGRIRRFRLEGPDGEMDVRIQGDDGGKVQEMLEHFREQVERQTREQKEKLEKLKRELEELKKRKERQERE